MHSHEDIVVDSSCYVRQLRRQMEAAGDLAKPDELILTCSDPVPALDALLEADGGPLLLRAPGASASLAGVKEALALALETASLAHIAVIGHSGCEHALHQCADADPGPALPSGDVMTRMRWGAERHQRRVEAARMNVRAQVKTLLAWAPVQREVEAGRLHVHGAVLLTESGVLQRYCVEADEFVADLRDAA